ncbi:hypothetical protein C8R43DRAFT_986350 [Mycena crocata]|nr:hypothetical protein C8R43DRAFT_986350 [Mycena crocata]
MKNQSMLRSSAASFSSGQSFDTIRRAPGNTATSVACSDDHRWSEVVPPDSGLTFAVVWDPEEEDILTFSTAELSSFTDRDPKSPDSPSDAFDSRSQVLTIGTSVIPASENTGTLEYFRDNANFLFAESAYSPRDRPMRGRTQTSSTMDGLDVYLRGSMLGKAHNANRYVSCFQDLDDGFSFDPRTSFAHKWMRGGKETVRDDVSDEGFFEGGQYKGQYGGRRYSGMDGGNEVNMSSSFSVTTTSTSNYITVENEMDDESSTWSALEAPNTPSYSRLLFTSPPSSTNHRLRKPRPIPGPASPSDVLERPVYNHSTSLPGPLPQTPERIRRTQSSPSTPRQRNLSLVPKFARGLGKNKKPEGPGWVWIDVKAENPSSP